MGEKRAEGAGAETDTRREVVANQRAERLAGEDARPTALFRLEQCCHCGDVIKARINFPVLAGMRQKRAVLPPGID